MKEEDIEIQIIHTPAMEKDNGFAIRVKINNEDASILELKKEQLLHIESILLNVYNVLNKNTIRIKNNK